MRLLILVLAMLGSVLTLFVMLFFLLIPMSAHAADMFYVSPDYEPGPVVFTDDSKVCNKPLHDAHVYISHIGWAYGCWTLTRTAPNYFNAEVYWLDKHRSVYPQAMWILSPAMRELLREDERKQDMQGPQNQTPWPH